MATNKEFFYVGHYIATSGEYVLKVGTTNDITRRTKEHNKFFASTPNYPRATEFVIDWFIPLSKYNTLRTEDRTKERFKKENFGEYVRNDRFVFEEKPSQIEITIRKTYTITLQN